MAKKAKTKKNKAGSGGKTASKTADKTANIAGAESEGEGGQMTIIDHLTELRNRLGVVFIAFLLLFVICITPLPGGGVNNSVAAHVFNFLQAPLAEVLEERGGGRMIFTALHEGFVTHLKVGFFTALCISFPIISIQLWKFIAPALYRNEKNAFLPFLIATPVLFMLGAAMVYYVVTPLAWDFFIGFESIGTDSALAIEIEPRISEYLSLIMRLIFAFGLAFELPVVLLLMVRAGIISPKGLASKRKFAIVIAFVVAAILTPPDVISQLLLALPIIALYEVSIIGARLIDRRVSEQRKNSVAG